MQVDVATYAGFKAFVNAIEDGAIEDGFEVTYHDAEGREIDREVFAAGRE